MNDPNETTEKHLSRLLGRALNSFDLSDATVERLETALAHASALHSSHHSQSLQRETYRHTYLLADGSALSLWELIHSTAGQDGPQYEVYEEEAEAHLAASRLAAAFPGSVAFPDEDAESDLEVLAALMSAPPAPLPRMYVPDNSADHARRVLRRAENEDRPGWELSHRLRAAFAHHITRVYGRQCVVGGKEAGFTLYEHAFLLLDGSEASLWEIEHTATPDGRQMCEVYGDERAARQAMEHRAQVR
ncbi:DUF6227 family protein [Streptomyces sp. NPDC050504]|uniref:DUF6227 family protein n=1 Tax=Streptomyces sp. NPDC050504 TaxID=3365618 RepID=UPI0037AC522C